MRSCSQCVWQEKSEKLSADRHAKMSARGSTGINLPGYLFPLCHQVLSLYIYFLCVILSSVR